MSTDGAGVPTYGIYDTTALSKTLSHYPPAEESGDRSQHASEGVSERAFEDVDQHSADEVLYSSPGVAGVKDCGGYEILSRWNLIRYADLGLIDPTSGSWKISAA